MGWLGWNERDSLDADVNSIILAMEGKVEMMYPGTKSKGGQNGLASAKFRSFARDHNIMWGKRHGQ